MVPAEKPRRASLPVVLAGALGAAAAAGPSVAGLEHHLLRGHASSVCLTATTGIVAALLLRRAGRAESTFGAIAWALVGGAIGGALNAGLSLAAITLVNDTWLEALAGLLLGTIVGGFFGAPLGFVFGVVLAPLVTAASKARRAPSHDAGDRLLVGAGLWLVVVATFLALAPFSRSPGIPFQVLVVVGVAFAAYGLTGQIARRRWLARVRAGLDPTWVLVPVGEGEDVSGLQPLFAGARRGAMGVLRRRAAFAPYRGSDARAEALAPIA